MPIPDVLAEFIAATKALVTAAQAVATHGVASDIAEAKKTLESAREAASQALKLKVQPAKKA
jgi:hypothetical protein